MTRENNDTFQNGEREGIWSRFEDVSWAAVQYSETSGYIWRSPLRSHLARAPFPSFLPFSVKTMTNNTNYSTWRGRTRSLRVRIWNTRASAAVLLVYLFYISLLLFLLLARRSVWNAAAKSWRESICPSLPLSLSLILTCVSSSALRPPASLPVSLLPLLQTFLS